MVCLLVLLVLVLLLNTTFSLQISPNDYSSLASLSLSTLRNTHLLLVGDSLMRYHYLSLVYLLRFHHVLLPSINHSPVNEHQWQSWPVFLQTVNSMFYPRERCDCYRENDKLYDAFENRYYYDEVHNITVTFYLYQLRTIKGSFYPDTSVNSTEYPFRDRTITNTSIPRWEMFVNDTLLTMIPKMSPRPQILIANIGVWHTAYESQLADMAAALQILHIPIMIWKTTSARLRPNDDRRHRGYYNSYDSFMCFQPRVYCHYLNWTHSLDRKLWQDDVHFDATVYYRIINESLFIIQKGREDYGI